MFSNSIFRKSTVYKSFSIIITLNSDFTKVILAAAVVCINLF